MKQLVYRSQPFGFDRAILAGILTGARRNNRRDAITGALICRHDVYLQLVEGPDTAVDALYAKILVDDRHSDIVLLLSGTVDQRLFPDWDMLHDEWPSLLWSPAEIVDGAVEAASAADLIAVFRRLSASAGTPDLHRD